ncbi:hypothetical protein AB0I16_18970 [Streptomyces sp. NPDC050703]|uniref:hypothetical protein n=1 Tax=Streptomyces sp. NPDC050703 TaxID=3157218 RepID=UPI003428E489
MTEKMVDPAGIPQFTGNLEQLAKDASGLRGAATGIRSGGADVHSRFQMLGAYYIAPEAEDLFSTTEPVMDKADTFAADLETVADALDTFASEVRPLAEKLVSLRENARKFVASVEGDDDWTDDGDKTDRNNELVADVTATRAAFEAAERRAASKISALVGGPRFIEDDGSHKATEQTVMYGYDADLLKQAKDLPWGSPVSQTRPDNLGGHLTSFFYDGFVKNGAVASVEGLGRLVGIGGSAKDAWQGLYDVSAGAGHYLMKPTDWMLDQTMFATEDTADMKRQKTAFREFGKAFVAWDQWEEHPAQAAGTVTFNALTFAAGPLGAVAKGGSAAAKAGAATGKVGLGTKAAGIGAKIGTYADPFSAALAVGGKAVGKVPTIAELTSRLTAKAETTPEIQGVHSVLEVGGHKVLVKDGQFLPLNAEGRPIRDTARSEAASTQRAAPDHTPSDRNLTLVGTGARGPEPVAHVGGHNPSQATHDAHGGGGGPDSPRHQNNGYADGASRSRPDDASFTSGATKSNTGASADSAPEQSAAGGPNNGEPTAAETRKIQEEHAWKANNDPAWRKKYYDEIGRRLRSRRKVDGVTLAELALDAQGKFVLKHDLPDGPSETRFGAKPLDRGTAPDGTLPALDEAAKHRELSRELLNAERSVKKDPSALNKATLDKAQSAFTAEFGSLHNNTKIAERLGTLAARLHVIAKVFPDARRIIDLPQTANGAHMFDDVYELGNDGSRLIVEHKAPGADLDWRLGRADPDPSNPHAGDDGAAQGMRVKQGTVPYIRTILAEMTRRGGRDAVIAGDLRRALKQGKLQYVLVQANAPLNGAYAGAVIEHLNIK